MYKRMSGVLFPILVIALIGAGVWGYQEHQEKNSVLIKAENQYQRAFHNLSYNLDQVHNELGKALALGADSHQFQRKSLISVWRMTNMAQSDVNQLPLALMPFNRTEDFLSKMADFAYRTSIRDLDKEPLTDDEMKTLHALYDYSKKTANEIRSMQAKVLQENLRWMDVEMALASEEEVLDNTIVDGFKTVDKQVNAYEDINWGPSTSAIFEKRGFKALSGKTVTEEEVKQKARQFFGLDPDAELTVTENGKGTEYASYSVVAGGGEDSHLSADYSKKGGHLIWFMNTRPVESEQLTVEQARERAQAFLRKHGFGDMQAVAYDPYNHSASLTMARVTDGVLIYPEKLTVRVALDNGEIVGLHAADYIYNQKERKPGKPKLSAEEARKSLNGNFDLQSTNVALIENEIKQEVLCYEFIGRINGGQYRIYINAENGMEEKLERLREADVDVNENVS
ncbi:germination protein YpeB [Xylanibacillus composti]|uniref:Germination protein YpeB n=1 Tax=Xylanibacillus composti TaxID=1572762 RepID=A0A8J4H8J9_9BACL|nr:germination protein YpeB [Xylanibacillus composti]MDT9725435.1 germination protein YpeB [Xylanibacillus composti]GIQ71049.1 germination protein YpeB [Xylanibacillus composti]